MIKGILLRLALPVCILANIPVIYAQDAHSKGYPSAIFVQLSAEQNRMQAAERAKRYKDLEELNRDAAAVITATKSDFKDHFNYRPVYYFIDTNIDLIKKRSFSGVLMNADGSIAAHAPTSDYLIVYYGFPITQRNEGSLQRGIVIADENEKQLHYSRAGLKNVKKNRKKYTYSSKHFDIDYKPIAGYLNDYLKQ